LSEHDFPLPNDNSQSVEVLWLEAVPMVDISYGGVLEAQTCQDYVVQMIVDSGDLNKDVRYEWEVTMDPFNADFD